jgi:hypothetical protein
MQTQLGGVGDLMAQQKPEYLGGGCHISGPAYGKLLHLIVKAIAHTVLRV